MAEVVLDADNPEIQHDGASTGSCLMSVAYEAVRKAKQERNLVPVRSLHHLPDFGTVLRPLKRDRVCDLTADMVRSGYRDSEPIFTTRPFPGLGFPRFILGGNHRAAAVRNAGIVLVPTYILDSKAVLRMMIIMEGRAEDGNDTPKEMKASNFMKSLKLLVLATQVKEPNPRTPTILQMITLIRTFIRNDCTSRPNTGRNRGVFGGFRALRKEMFGDCGLQSNSSVHFLLNKEYTSRQLNKCMKGCQVLIDTQVLNTLPGLGERKTLLDMLLHWEHEAHMPTFSISHLCNAGEVTAVGAAKVIDRALRKINRNIRKASDIIALTQAPFLRRRNGTVGAEWSDESDDDGGEGDEADDDVQVRDSETGNDPGINAVPPAVEVLTGSDVEQRDLDDVTGDGNAEATNEGGDNSLRRSSRKRKAVHTYEVGAAAVGNRRSKIRRIVKGRASPSNKTVVELKAQVEEERRKARQRREEDERRIVFARHQVKEAFRKRKKVEAELKAEKASALDSLKSKFEADMKMLSIEHKKTLMMERARKEAVLSKKSAPDHSAGLQERVNKEAKREAERMFASMKSAELKKIREENENLRKEKSKESKLSMLKSDEVAKIRKELEKLKQEKQEQLSEGVAKKMEALMKENEALKSQLASDSNENPADSGRRSKRNALPSEKALRMMPLEKVKELLEKAQRVLKDM